jgi:polyisoprenoid-binding protein YceI
MSATAAALKIPGYIAGTWTIDPVHSEIGFSVRHMMVSKVRGRFATFSGSITTAEDPAASSATAEIVLASIDTNNEQRDGHLRSADFFNAESDEKMTWTSTGLKIDGDSVVAEGELTLLGVTKSVPLSVEFNGIGPDAFGGTRAGFSATAEINRSDFGLSYNMAIEAGGFVIGEKVTIHLEIEAVLDAPAA